MEGSRWQERDRIPEKVCGAVTLDRESRTYSAPQRFDRIDQTGATRGQIAGEECHRRERDERAD